MGIYDRRTEGLVFVYRFFISFLAILACRTNSCWSILLKMTDFNDLCVFCVIDDVIMFRLIFAGSLLDRFCFKFVFFFSTLLLLIYKLLIDFISFHFFFHWLCSRCLQSILIRTFLLVLARSMTINARVTQLLFRACSRLLTFLAFLTFQTLTVLLWHRFLPLEASLRLSKRLRCWSIVKRAFLISSCTFLRLWLWRLFLDLQLGHSRWAILVLGYLSLGLCCRLMPFSHIIAFSIEFAIAIRLCIHCRALHTLPFAAATILSHLGNVSVAAQDARTERDAIIPHTYILDVDLGRGLLSASLRALKLSWIVINAFDDDSNFLARSVWLASKWRADTIPARFDLPCTVTLTATCIDCILVTGIVIYRIQVLNLWARRGHYITLWHSDRVTVLFFLV